MKAINKMLCLVDGEHYLPVTQQAIDTLNNLEHIDVAGAVFIGGTEKLRDDSEETYSQKLGVPVQFAEDKDIPYDIIVSMIRQYNIDTVMDLSDEPILDYPKRFKIACSVLNEGISYEGPDFKFEPVSQYDIMKKPSITILGTGKRIGKTAVSGFVSRLIDKNNYEPCVIAMGRGGPSEPEIVHGEELEITSKFLLEQSEKGIHAASDHWEDALMSRILTIGCRRCGGGMAGEVFLTNMKKGAKLANEVDSKLAIFEGSGAAIPPIKTDKKITLVGANQPIETVTGYFGPYRISLGDLIILTMCEEPMASKDKIAKIEEFIQEINPDAPIISTVFRPKPLEDISGKNVLFATTAPEGVKDKLVQYLEKNYKCKIIGTTSHLSNRPLLREDMKKYMDNADVMLSELKAAAVDVATKDAINAGLDVVYCDNIPIPINDTYPDLSKTIINLVNSAIDNFDNQI
ncbi:MULTISPECIES: 2,3-diphosphoglycerate synthetase [Methanobrevibacter]|uniref:Cyclic 2,3-diphosphoglycerate synthetase n=1 Tax=Methanobrevibacter gottschalkii DSM 11977 TaxID=1122229 RepID=A0A3N5BQB2_9EURY|nr:MULTISPECIES: 2,3-diphosphoglycerate synthetase [Methanobrevibacter]OEC98715.1 2,3-diphosphoglycerate synthetase [Methanobrevibacter sp. A27]RPF51948.1 cyclic 2,3-diphosphoglycerate synthetase [Methanobrevibacter gottschalkii DSM 11977]